MEEHRAKCVESEKYAEAEQTKKRIAELKAQQEKLKLERKKKVHQETKDQMKNFFETTLEEERKDWDQKVADLKENFLGIENEMIERQKKELEELHNKLETALPVKAKPSSALLNLRMVQQNLVKQKKYAEANETKQKAQAIEADEDEKWTKIRAEKIAVQEAQLMQKHNKEREAHAKRVKTALAEMEIERNKRLDQLVHNYNNTKKQTVNIHNIEMAHISKLEKRPSPREKVSEVALTDSSPTKS